MNSSGNKLNFTAVSRSMNASWSKTIENGFHPQLYRHFREAFIYVRASHRFREVDCGQQIWPHRELFLAALIKLAVEGNMAKRISDTMGDLAIGT